MIASMAEYLEAPFPYIIGVSRDLWKSIHQNKWDVISEEIVAFDIDHCRTYQKEPLPKLPDPYGTQLINQLKAQLDKYSQVKQQSS